MIDRTPEVVPDSAGFEALVDLIVRSPHTEFFVVNAKRELLGSISPGGAAPRSCWSASICARWWWPATSSFSGRPSVTTDDDLDLAMQLLGRANVDEIAVIDALEPRRLLGSVHKRDVIHAWNQEVMRRDLAGGIAGSMASVERVHEVELGDDFVVRDVAAPHGLAGRTLGALDLRARTGAMVLLIRRPSAGRGAVVRVPTPTDRIEDGDILIAAGTREALERLERGRW